MTIFDNVYSEAKPRRSLLFVPGSRLEMLPKAFATATDIVCIDLEDAVTQKQKLSVRKSVISVIQKQLSEKPDTDKEIWIRINTIRSTDGLEDIIAIARADTAPDGIMIPKIHTPEEIKTIAENVKDPNFRIQISDAGIHVFNRDGFVTEKDPFAFFPDLKLNDDASHAFYMGVELARAEVAWRLGKRYAQDRGLDWGVSAEKLSKDMLTHCQPGTTLKDKKRKKK